MGIEGKEEKGMIEESGNGWLANHCIQYECGIYSLDTLAFFL